MSDRLPLYPSEEEMHAIRKEAFDFVGVGLYRYTFDGIVIFMDRNMLRLFEIEDRYPDPAMVIGKQIADLFTYTGPPGRLREAIRQTGVVRNMEYPFKTLKGTPKWVLHDSYLIRDPQTGEEAIQAIVQDITARKQAENELHRMNAELDQHVRERTAALAQANEELARTRILLETLLAQAPVGFAYFDRELRFKLINERLANINGFPVAAHIDKRVQEIVPSLAPIAEMMVQRILTTGQPVLNYEFSGETPAAPGVTRYWNESWYPVRVDAGNIIGFGVIVEEITERKKLEETIQRLLTQAREEKDRLTVLFDSIQDEIWFTDTHGVFTLANPSALRAFGLRSNEPVEVAQLAASLEILRPDGTPRPLEEAPPLRALRGEIVHNQEEIVRLPKSGELHYRRVNSTPVKSPDGTIIGVVSVARDVTELKNIEQALSASEARFRAIFEQAAVGIAEMGLDGHWLKVNQRTSEIIGYPREALLRLSFQALTDPEDLPKNEELFRQLIQGDIPSFIYDKRFRTQNGATVWASLTASLVRRSDGSPNYVIEVIEDITERKHAEIVIQHLNEALQRRAQELEAANKEMEAFTYSVSHDLRAPLRAIDGFSQAVLEDYADRLDEEGRDDLRFIRHGAQQMARLIDDLLRLSRVGRAEMRWEPVDLSALVREIADELHRQQPNRQVEWHIEPDLHAFGDQPLLRIMLENLLGNAWKFTSKRPDARIDFFATHAGNETVYAIRDNGAGFDMAYLAKLFVPFQRLHNAEEFSGTGIGLAIVQRIINRHGGRIWAEGKVDQGATFYFMLPERR